MTNDTSNPVIPLEADGVQPGFDIVLRGYDRGQVDRQIGWLEEQLGAADREATGLTEALRRAESDSAEARRQAEKAAAELARGRPTFEALGERIGTILRLAEEEADALRHDGAAEVERARNAWAAELAGARRALAEEQRAAQQQAAAILAQARQEAQAIVTDARRSAAETTSAAQRQVDAMSRQQDAIHTELLRVRERFAAVMGWTIDVTDERDESEEPVTETAAEQTVVTATPRQGSESDPATTQTQHMPAGPTA
jgi:chromosome segregation ATPase